MSKSLVFTVIGPDRPGLVERIAACVEAHGGNWEEGRMQAVGGQFAGLLGVSVSGDAEALRAALDRLPDVRVVVTDAVEGDALERKTFEIRLLGADRPGIVHLVSRALAGLEINIRELESWTERAPMSGEPTFRAAVTLETPPSVSAATLQTRLEAIANELMVEIAVSD